jgi:hypothetical protein
MTGACSTAAACVVLFLLAAGLSGCAGITGSGKLTTTQVDKAGFTEVRAADSWALTLVRGDTYSVKVTSDDNLVDRLAVAVDGNALVLRLKPGIRGYKATLRATIVMPTLAGLDLADFSHATVTGFSSGSPLTVSLGDFSSVTLNALRSGALGAHAGDSSTISGSILVDEGSLRLGDSSDATLSGSARALTLQVSDGSSLDLSHLRATNVTVTLGDGSHGTVAVDGTLDVRLGDDSSLKYVGSPKLGSSHIGDGSSLLQTGAQGQ